jgi:hypothetical protein
MKKVDKRKKLPVAAILSRSWHSPPIWTIRLSCGHTVMKQEETEPKFGKCDTCIVKPTS